MLYFGIKLINNIENGKVSVTITRTFRSSNDVFLMFREEVMKDSWYYEDKYQKTIHIKYWIWSTKERKSRFQDVMSNMENLTKIHESNEMDALFKALKKLDCRCEAEYMNSLFFAN